MKTKFVGLAMVAGLLLFVFGTAFAIAPAQTNTSSTLQQSTMSSAWTGWSQVPGNGFTLSGPGATVYQNKLFLFVRGTDNRIYQNLNK
jgi:hypothetical protein